MTQSTATATPEDLHIQPKDFFAWEVPQKPGTVHISLDVVDRLEREVVEAFRAVTKRGSEIGGLLLGRMGGGNRRSVIIEDYEPVTCDYSRGPLYLLADEDKVRLKESIQQYEGGARKGLRVVGFFRSNTRRDLALDEEDLTVIQEYFSSPDSVILLVKPFATKVNLAGFFIWEDGQMRTEASYLEFPFQRAELEKGASPKPAAASGTTASPDASSGPNTEARPAVLPFTPKREEPAKAAPPAVKREERASVLPFAVKREDPVPAPKAEKVAPAPPIMRKAAAPPAETVRPKATPEAAETPKEKETIPARAETRTEPVPTAQPVTAKPTAETSAEAAKTNVPSKPEPVESEAPIAAATEPGPERDMFSALGEPATPNKKRWVWIGAAVVLLAASGGYFAFRPRVDHVAQQPAVAAQDNSSLSLRAERNQGQLLLTWNREAAVVKDAQHAVLAITDGKQKDNVELDMNQLRSGSIVYSPLTDDVSFRLEVSGSKQGESQSESVRVLGGRPSPMPAGSKEAESKATPPKAGETAGTEEAQANPGNDATTAPSIPEEATRPTPRPFHVESLASRISAPAPASLLAPPKLQLQATTAGTRPVVSTAVTMLPPPPPAKPASAPPSATEQTPQVGGVVQEAELVRRVDPVYPIRAKESRISGVVRLMATVGKNGKVKDVKVISGPPFLRQSAIEAVKQWVYRPSLLNGEPIEAFTQIDVNFSLSGR